MDLKEYRDTRFAELEKGLIEVASAFDIAVPPDVNGAHATMLFLIREGDRVRDEFKQIRAQKDGAYGERNRLVAALAKIFPASLERHPDEDESWENDWRWIVFIDLPTGQASWHIHDSELPQFGFLPREQGRRWDGHTTEQKYERLAALAPGRYEA